jgi:hypothetical protein
LQYVENCGERGGFDWIVAFGCFLPQTTKTKQLLCTTQELSCRNRGHTHQPMSAEHSSLTSSPRLDSDPPRGRKRGRRGDVCSAEEQEQGEKQQRRRLWQGEASAQTTMTDRIREGGRGRSSSHLQPQLPFANQPKLQPTLASKRRRMEVAVI